MGGGKIMNFSELLNPLVAKVDMQPFRVIIFTDFSICSNCKISKRGTQKQIFLLIRTTKVLKFLLRKPLWFQNYVVTLRHLSP